jgi:hypothetical protein
LLSWSGLPVVTVRPTVFLEGFFLLLAAAGVRASDELALPTGCRVYVSSSCRLGYVQKTNWRRGALPMYREFAAAGGLIRIQH